jgi:uncharacterized protein (TIGR02266 family)
MSGSSPQPDGSPRLPREEATFSSEQDSPTPDNRRHQPRYSVDLDVTMSSDHNFYAGFAENISSGGLFVATYVKRPKGDRLEIVMNIPGHPEPIRAIGEVRWSREYSEHSNVPPGLGVRFVELPEHDAKIIENFVKDREPIFYDDD